MIKKCCICWSIEKDDIKRGFRPDYENCVITMHTTYYWWKNYAWYKETFHLCSRIHCDSELRKRFLDFMKLNK